MKRKLAIILLPALLGSCALEEFANQTFGDQHIKTSIALIELHKVRYGQYPEDLDDLKHLGGWDQLHLKNVEYRRLGDGYELNLTGGWSRAPSELEYPPDFWQGLGLVRSNLKPE